MQYCAFAWSAQHRAGDNEAASMQGTMKSAVPDNTSSHDIDDLLHNSNQIVMRQIWQVTALK